MYFVREHGRRLGSAHIIDHAGVRLWPHRRMVIQWPVIRATLMDVRSDDGRWTAHAEFATTVRLTPGRYQLIRESEDVPVLKMEVYEPYH